MTSIAVTKAHQTRLSKFHSKWKSASYYDMASKREISMIVDNVLIPHEGKILSEEVIEELVERLSKFIVSRIQRE